VEPAGIDEPGVFTCGDWNIADCSYPPAANANVGPEPRPAGAIDNRSTANDYIECQVKSPVK
jgi:hypothetical protein